MVRCLLHASNLGPEFWSYAILHAAYLKNRLPHSAINVTPYEAYTGKRPSARHLRIFGCAVIVKNPGKRPAKLDTHTSTGIFLGYTATDKNIYFMDTQTKRIKIATHCQFDEAGMTIPPAQRSQACQALQATGYTGNTSTEEPTLTCPTDPSETEILQVKLLSPQARLPTRATQEAAGYDVYSPVDCHIEPHSQTTIPLDISITPPQGTYSQLITRSGHATKHKLTVQAGVIDRDYTGNVRVIIYNYGDTPYKVKQGDRIAQLIIIKHAIPTCISVPILATTARSDNGLGSTGTSERIIQPTIHQVENDTPEIGTEAIPNPAPDTESRNMQEVTATTNNDDQMPYDIYLSQDPFDQRLQLEIALKGDHPTVGLMMTQCPQRQRLRLQDMTLSTPGSRIPRWRSTLRNAYLINIEGTRYTLRKIY